MISLDYNIKIEGDADDGYNGWVNDELVAEGRSSPAHVEELINDHIRNLRKDAELLEKRTRTTFDVTVSTDSYWRDSAAILGIDPYSYSSPDHQFMSADQQFTLTCKVERMTGDVYVTAFNGVVLGHPAKITPDPEENNDESKDYDDNDYRY